MNEEFRDWLESEIQYLEDVKYASSVEFGIQKKLELVIKKYDELSKPVVIPKYVADFIKVRKYTDAYSLQYIFCIAMERSDDERLKKEYDWISANDEAFARAWMDGYEVEEEQKYCVNDGNNILLCKWESPDGWRVISTVESANRDLPFGELDFRLTEHEIKGFDPRYWAFRKPIDKTVNE